MLLVRVGEIGHTALVRWDYPFHIYVNLAVLRAGPRLSPLYLEAVSQGEDFQRALRDRALLHAVPKKINLSSIAEVRVALPSYAEQERIADALNNIDEQLRSATAECDKLEITRTAAIDALLIPTVRLPNFSGMWQRRPLGSVCHVAKGQQLGRAALDRATGYPVWNGGVEPSGFSSSFNTEGPACIISEGGNSCGSVNWVDSNFWCGGHCYVVSPIDDNVLPRFLYYTTKAAEEQIKALRVGSGLPNIQKERLIEFEINLPPSVAEQQAIAAALSDIDQALAAARAVVAKVRGLKGAAMDALLSGRVRLPPFGQPARRAPSDALEAA